MIIIMHGQENGLSMKSYFEPHDGQWGKMQDSSRSHAP